MGGRPNEGLAWAEKGIALAGEHGVENVVRHLQFRGIARLELGDTGGLSDMRDALDLSLRLGLGIETATSYGNLGESVAGFEGLTVGLEFVEGGLDFARRRGLKHHEMWSRTARLVYLYELGKWDELLHEADEIAGWDRDQAGGSQIEVWTLIASAPVHAQRGRPDEARRDAVTFLPRAREVADPQMLVPALTFAALAFAAGGDLDQAVALAAEFERTARMSAGSSYPVLPTILRVCAATGELTLAQTLVERSAEAADSQLRRHSETTGRAIVAEAYGNNDDAAALYRAAADGWDEWGSVVERAYALHGLGGCGDEDAARDAAAIFEHLGAKPVLARAA
jgi:hypothetical protein